MHDIQFAPVRAHAFQRLHVDVFDDLVIKLAERADTMDRNRQHTGHRSETKGDHEDQREHDARNGAAKFEETARHETHRRMRRSVGGREEIQAQRANCTDGRADVTQQQRLCQQLEPALPAPEPFSRIGPNPRAGVEMQDTVKIADEIADLLDQCLRRDFSAETRDHQQRHENHKPDQKADALARNRRIIRGFKRRDLLGRIAGETDGQMRIAL